MKKVLSTLVMAVVLLSSTMVQAENLGADRAREAAARFMRQNTSLVRLTADQLTLVRQWNNPTLGVPSMYLFSTTGEGWIIMAATTSIDPVVGFSDDSEINPDCLAPQLEWWLESYNDFFCYVQDLEAENPYKPYGDSPEWNNIFASNSQNGRKGQIIFAKERWDQGDESGTDYNIYCPVVNDSVCPVGCVATAMAQICHYYKYPKVGKYQKTYRWYFTENGVRDYRNISMKFDTIRPFNYDIMPNKISVATNLESRREVSRLGYYLGISVKMEYAPSGSGSQSTLVPDAMMTNWKYQAGSLINRSATSSTDTHFINSLRRELLQSRPVYMSGASSSGSGRDAAGHAWTCCGYHDNNETQYYMNWGWNGSGNGFFNLYTNDMAVFQYNFQRRQSIIVNLVPPADSMLSVSEVDPTIGLGNAYPNPASYSVTIPYNTTSAAELQVYDMSGRLVENRQLHQGNGEVTLRVDSMPAGVYIYRVGTAYGKFVVR